MNATIQALPLRTRRLHRRRPGRFNGSPARVSLPVPRPPGITDPFVLRFSPGHGLRLRLAVQDTLNGTEPIHREHDLPYYPANGQKLTDGRQMRQGLIRPVAEHLQKLQSRYPGEQVLGFTGNGNLLANYRFVAWLAGQLLCLRHEPVFTQAYTALVSWKSGAVTVEDLWFGRENGRVIVMRKQRNGHGAAHLGTVPDINGQIDFVTTGQPLVRHGQLLPLEQVAELWYDTRHLVQPLALRLPRSTLFVPNAQLQQGLMRKALTQAVQIKLTAQVDEALELPLSIEGWLKLAQASPEALARAGSFLQELGLLAEGQSLAEAQTLLQVAEQMESLLKAALDAAGYHLVEHSGPLEEGGARFTNGHLEIFFRKAIYPHNIFVRWPDGRCGFVVFPGKSGRAGTTLPYAQEFLTTTLAVHDAVLLDNGGDARLWYRGQYLVPSSEGREELRSILAVTAPAGAWVGDRIRVC